MRILLAFLSLSLLHPGENFAGELLVRKKVNRMNANALSVSDSAPARLPDIEVHPFATEEEKKNLIESLNPDEMEWEENQVYSADDYSLSPQILSEIQDAPLFLNQWNLNSRTENPSKFESADIAILQSWGITQGSDNVIVYDVDSGIVDGPEPAFAGRVIAGYNALNPGAPPTDDNGHGTHTASIVVADKGIRGVSPKNVKLGVGKFLDASNKGNTDAAIKVYKWIHDNYSSLLAANPKMHCIVDNSWGGGFSQALFDEMKSVADLGCLLVTSAGNHGKNNDQVAYYPCNFKIPGNTCVAASDSHDKRAVFSGYGPGSVHLYAPGVDILGIVPGTMKDGQYVSAYEQKSGTSQALPQVGGVAALIWSANPDLVATDVHDILIKSVDRIPGAEEEVLSGGRLNAYRAVLIATGQDPSLADRGLASQAEGAGGDGGGCSMKIFPNAPTAPRVFNWGLGLSLAMVFWLRKRVKRSYLSCSIKS